MFQMSQWWEQKQGCTQWPHSEAHLGHEGSVEGGEASQSFLPDLIFSLGFSLVGSWHHAGWESRIERIVPLLCYLHASALQVDHLELFPGLWV